MRKYYLITILSILFSFVLLSSCEVINPSEDIPCYLRIDSFVFVDTTVSPSIIKPKETQKIVDAWVFVDGALIGVFDYPCEFPILIPEGIHRVRVYAGVYQNGSSVDREIYPFFTSYDEQVNFKLGKVVRILPRYAYNFTVLKFPPEAVGQFPEGFEGAGTIFKITAGSSVDTISRTSIDSIVLDGNYSGLIKMNSTAAMLDMETITAYTLPTNKRPVYLELSYRTDVTLKVGIYGINNASGQVTNVPFINLNPSKGQWRRVYLNISSEVSSFSNSKFKIYIKADHLSTQSESTILLDNIQLIYQ